MFKKYMHIERIDTDEVDGILNGLCYIFPKIDGTNGSVWMDGDDIFCASRNRILSKDADNAGFYPYVQRNYWRFESLLGKYPEWRLFGEWLVPHSIKSYRDDAWRKFYVFDIYDHEVERYVPYDEYHYVLDHIGVEFIPPQCIVERPERSHIDCELERNFFLLKDGDASHGEGLVIKNYDFINKYHRTVWAKVVTNRFKESHARHQPTVKAPAGSVERKIIDKYVTKDLCDKNYQKIVVANNGWNSRRIPQLFGMVTHDLIKEELWDALKAFKNPTIDFRALKRMVPAAVKRQMPKLF